MKNIMRESAVLEEWAVKEGRMRQLSERKIKGDQLFEKWQKRPYVGEGMDKLYEENPDKARGVAMILENQQEYLTKLSEAQVSSTFSTTPENVIRIVRLGYPNSVRDQIFHVWDMQTARDSMYYQYAQYGSTKRGATVSTNMIESAAYRYFSEVEEEAMADGGSQTTYTLTTTYHPVRPFSVRVLVDGYPVATDDGNGTIVGAITGYVLSAGTITYSSGVTSITFSVARAATAVVTLAYNFDSEVTALQSNVGTVNLYIRDYQFRAKPYPLYVSWNKMSELTVGTTLGIDMEESLLTGAAEELKKSLDFHALREGYRYASSNSSITFNADFATAGADSEVAHFQSIGRYINKAADVIYAAKQRGGVTKIFGGANAVGVLASTDKFTGAGAQAPIGAYKVGAYDGIDVFKVPASIVPTNELVCVYRDETEANNVALAFGTLIPLYQTDTLEYKNAEKETGLYSFGDWKALEPQFLVKIVMSNL